MINFYIERQSDDRLKASFFGENNEYVGHTNNISVDQIDSAVEDIFPDSQKKQIFELPNGC